MNAKRVLISLLDKTSQYILAEATPTLSLQRDADHGEADAMFFGTTILPRTKDWTDETIKLARRLRTKLESDGEDAALCIPDLVSDPRYASHPHVSAQPFVRSYIGVPLMTPSGYAIGTLAVLDDQTRIQGVTRLEMRFLRDVATSVMSHLELARTQTVHCRGVRLVKGLSRFIEGKDTIFKEKASVVESQRSEPSISDRSSSNRTHALGAGSNAERTGGNQGAAQSYFIPRRSQPRRRSATRLTDHDATRSPKMSYEDFGPETNEGSTSVRMRQPSATELQEDAISGNIGQAFQRAAKLMQQAMDMAGVLFLDASTGQFGSLTSYHHGDGSSGTSPRGSHMGSISGTDTTRTEETERAASQAQLKACRYLGAAYQEYDDGTTDITHQEVPEKFLRSLQRRYPYGKIFNYDSEGLMCSSDEHSDSSESGVRRTLASQALDAEATAKRKKLARSDSMKLLAIFPGIRSLAIMPMYDSQRARHIAGALIWSYDATRLFSFQDDLNYLGAFCDVLMAEVGRLDYQAEARSKTNVVSGTSILYRSLLTIMLDLQHQSRASKSIAWHIRGRRVLAGRSRR